MSTVKNTKDSWILSFDNPFKTTVVRHRQSLRSANCFNNLFNKIFSDSKIAQKFSYKQTNVQTNNKLGHMY